MKQLAAVAVVGLLLVSSARAGHAQGIALGVVGGVNVATLSIEDEETDINMKVGMRAGLHLSVDVSPQFGIILEALYSQKGATATEGGVDIGFHLDYVEFPLFAKFMIPTNQSGTAVVHLAAGPTVGLEFDCTLKGEEGGISLTVDCDEYGIDTKNLDFGVAALAGIEVQAGPGAVMFDVGYNLGIMDINDAGDGSIKNRNLYFQAGYKLTLGSK